MQTLHLTTDQNVPIEVELASIGQRLVSTLIDTMVMGVYFALMAIMLAYTFESSMNIYNPNTYDLWMFLFVFLIFLPFVLYTPLTEFLFKGQTVGKMMIGIRVTKINGENASFKDYFTRWLFRPFEVYFLFFAYDGIGLLLLFASFFFDTLISSISGKSQRIGDFMANTVVVRTKPSKIYSVGEIMSIKKNDNYEPKYQNITIYTDEDMMLVKKVINRVETYRNQASKDLAIELADKIADDLNLPEKPEKKFKFLKTVLDDYIVLTR